MIQFLGYEIKLQVLMVPDFLFAFVGVDQKMKYF